MGSHHSTSSSSHYSSSSALIGAAKQQRAKSLPQVKCLSSSRHGCRLQRFLQRASNDSNWASKLRSDSSTATDSSSTRTLASHKGSRNQLERQQLQVKTNGSKTRLSADDAAAESSSNGHVSATDKLMSSINGKRVLRKIVRDCGQAKSILNGAVCVPIAAAQPRSSPAQQQADPQRCFGERQQQQQQQEKRTKFAERRRNTNGSSSLGAEDSDVFIYPPNYRHMNECQKCARDNKICNCTVGDQPSGRKSSSSSLSSTSEESSSSLSSSLSSSCDSSERHCHDSGRLQKGIDGPFSMGLLNGKLPGILEGSGQATGVSDSSLTDTEARAARAAPATEVPSKRNAGEQLVVHKVAGEAQFTRVYQVNIAPAAPIDQPRLVSTGQSMSCADKKAISDTSSSELLVSSLLAVSSFGRSNTSIVTTISTSASAQPLDRAEEQTHQQTAAPTGAHQERGASNNDAAAIRLRAGSVPMPKSMLAIQDGAAQCCAAAARRSLAPSASLSSLPLAPIVAFARSPSNCSPYTTTTTTTTLEYLSSKSLDHLEATAWSRRSWQQQQQQQAVYCCEHPSGISSTSMSIAANNRQTQAADSTTLEKQLVSAKDNDRRLLVTQRKRTISARRRHYADCSTSAWLQREEHTAISSSSGSLASFRCPFSELENEKEHRLVGANRLAASKAVAIAQVASSTAVVDTDILEYSPILTSMRDYIETLNPGLLALQTAPTLTSQPSPPTVCLESQQMVFGHSLESAAPAPISTLPLVAVSRGQVPVASSLADVVTSLPSASLCSSASTIAASEAPTIVTSPEGLTIVAPCTVSSSAASGATIASTSVDTTSSSYATAPPSSYSESAAGAATGANAISTAAGEPTLLAESPKKSIFEGASKDEILEYLEDARGRVPEVLIAADDVMVINENELILVNQLEPNSPATPISIVEAPDAKLLLATSGASIPLAPAAQKAEDQQKLDRKLSQRRASLRQRIPSAFASTMVTVPSDAPATAAMQPNEIESSLDLSRFSGQLDNGWSLGPASTATMDGQQLEDIINNSSSGNKQLRAEEFAALVSSGGAQGYRFFRSMVGGEDGDAKDASVDYQLSAASSETTPEPCLAFSEGASGASRRPDSRLDFSTGEASSTTDYEDQQHLARLELGQQGLQCHALRRKSTSEVSSKHQRQHNVADKELKSGGGSGCVGKSATSSTLGTMMLLQKRLLNNNSLTTSSSSSSTSSSSPNSSSSDSSSSASPHSSSTPASSSSSSSSCASSNRTSGNYSATSAFYASSSLSCSSPFIALGSAHNTMQGSNATRHGKDDTKANVVEREDSGLSGDYAAVAPPLANLAASKRAAAKESQETAGKSAGNNSNVQPTGEELNASRLSVIEEQLIEQRANRGKLSPEQQQQRQQLQPRQQFNFNSTQAPAAQSKPLVQQRAAPRHGGGHYAAINHKVNNHRHHHHHRPISDEDLEASTEFQCLDCDQLIVVDGSNSLATLLASGNNSAPEAGAATAADCPQTKEANREIPSNEQSEQQAPRRQSILHRAYGLPLCKSCEKKRTERKEIISEFVETELKYGRDLKIIHDEFYRPMQIAGLLNKDQIRGIFLNLDELILAHRRFAERLVRALNEAHAMGDTDYDCVSLGRLFVESSDMLQTFESYCVRQGSAACLLARLAKEKELLRIFLRVSQMENTLLRRMNLAAFLMVPVQRVTKYPLLLNRLYKVTPYHHKDRESLRDAQLRVELHLEHINQQTKGISATNKIWRRISNLSAPHNYSSHHGSGAGSGGRRGLVNAEDIGYIKLRKTAIELLKWDRDETQFIHSGKINFAPLNEYLVKQKVKSLRYMTAHALLVVRGKANWKYRPDLVKSNLDSRLMTPTFGGTGISEAALLLFREKNGRFVSCREPILLSNCVLSNDCSQFNCEYGLSASLAAASQYSASASASAPAAAACNSHSSLPPVVNSTCQQRSQTAAHSHQRSLSTSNASTSSSAPLQQRPMSTQAQQTSSSSGGAGAATRPEQTNRKSLPGLGAGRCSGASLDLRGADSAREPLTGDCNDGQQLERESLSLASGECNLKSSTSSASHASDSISMSSLKSLPEERTSCSLASAASRQQQPPQQCSPPPLQAPRSYSLASALPRAPMVAGGSSKELSSPPTAGTTARPSASSSSNLTILNQLMTKVNSYHQAHGKGANGGGAQAPKASPPPSGAALHGQARADQSNQSGQGLQTSGRQQPAQKQAATMEGNNGTIGQQQQQPGLSSSANTLVAADGSHNNGSLAHYNHHFFHAHHQPYGDYEESFEIHERLSKESLLLRADTPLKTRYWLQMLRYHAKDLGLWRARRNGLANIMMMMRQE